MEISEVKRKIIDLVYSRNRPVFDGVENEWWKKDGTPRTRRIIIVYNPRSSKAMFVKDKVFGPLREIKGVMIGKYEIQPTDVDDNAKRLAEFLLDGDIVVTAGGDGTATIGLNGVILSEKIVRFMALPYGNFNDMARTLAKISGGELYPLEAKIDGEHYRYAACYFTLGMFAESTEIFDGEETRKKLRKGNKGMMFSIMTLMSWYFKNKRRKFMPKFQLTMEVKKERGGAQNNERDGNSFTRIVELETKTRKVSDYLAVNGATMAKMMRGDEKCSLSRTEFLSATGRLTSFFRLVIFMMRSVLFKVPARVVKEAILDFSEEGEIEIQAEGEYKKVSGVKQIVISKSEQAVKIL